MTKNWEIFPSFILRSTGFPFNHLASLAFTQTAASLDALLDCEDRLNVLRAEIQAALYADQTPETRNQRRRFWNRIDRNRSLSLQNQNPQEYHADLWAQLQQWNLLLSQYETLQTEAETTFADELVTKRRILRDLVSNERFQEAVWLSSPQMYQYGLRRYLKYWHAHKRPSDIRRLERQIIAYLQRFCAKNETTSFFGPINYGDLQTADGHSLAGPGYKHIQQRRTFIAYWAIQAMASAIADDPYVKPYLQPYPIALCQLNVETNQITIGYQVTLRLPALAVQLLQQVDGQRTIKQLADLLASPLSDVCQLLSQLVKIKVVNLAPPVPVTVLDPLAWLQAWVERLPLACHTKSHWRQALAKFKYLQEQFASAPFAAKRALLVELEDLFVTTTQKDARRGAGEFYADRLMIYEEVLGGMSPFNLGETFAAELQAQLTPLLNLSAAHALDAHQQQQSYGVTLVSELAGNGRVSFLGLAAHLHQQNIRFEPEPSLWQRAILSQLVDRADTRQVAIDLAAIPPFDEALSTSVPLLTSPDVMLLARDEASLRAGDFQVVLAECHDTFMLWGWALYFHPEYEKVTAAARDLLMRIRGDQILTNVLTSKRVKIVPFEYPGPTIEIMTPSEKPPRERIPIAQVEVGVENGRVTLNAPGWDNLTLYNGELPTIAHSLFALPKVVPPQLAYPQHTPRITLGKAVLQRERWRVPFHALFPHRYQGASLALMRDFRRAVRNLGLPRYLFARMVGEPKPIFVDRDNYFLLELLHHLIPDGADTVLSEMLPTPDDLWLRQDGKSFCAELRLSIGYVSN